MFEYSNLKLFYPDFNSPLTDLIIELDFLRKKKLGGSTHPSIFFQLKNIFHMLESIGSARIEGNNTTIAEYIESKFDKTQQHSENIIEIFNMEKALQFIDDNINSTPIGRDFICKLHQIAVEGLSPTPNGEGDPTPGMYRTIAVRINGSQHIPPHANDIQWYMDELFDFLNKADAPKYDLLKAAIAHHRFVWIHPFTNGNGRTVRLFTYAILVRLGFRVNVGRIINPSAVFCSNRNNYNNHLCKADSGKKEDILEWCEYMLHGLKIEIDKIDKLSDFNYLKKEILIPTIDHSLERKLINLEESKILKRAIEKQIIKATDIKDFFPGKHPADISHFVNSLKDKKMLSSIKENSRKYFISFNNNYLLRGFIKILGEKGFLPIN